MPVPGFNRPGDGAGGLKIPDKLNFVANLNARYQTATMADSVATLINKILNLGYVGSGRKASGTGYTSASGLFTVSGLAFQPTLIIMEIDYSTNHRFRVYLPTSPTFTYRSNINSDYLDIMTPSSSSGDSNAVTPKSDGFTYQTPWGNSSVSVTWIAVEF